MKVCTECGEPEDEDHLCPVGPASRVYYERELKAWRDLYDRGDG